MANGKYERIGRTLLHEGAITDLYSDRISLPDNREESWDLIHHIGAAAVVPVRSDGKILMVRQWRNPNQEEMLEIPAGKLDAADEPTIEAAKRECEEETGYAAKSLTKLVSFRPTVAYSDEKIDIYLATDLEEGTQKLDDDEFLGVEAWDLEDLLSMIYEGKMEDGKSIAGILAYAFKKKQN